MRELYTTARYYDLFYDEEFVGDEEFWRLQAEETPGPILELGCGTGRVTLDLAQRGHEIVGLDASEAMLDAALTKLKALPKDVQGRTELVVGDMAKFSLGRKFGLIIIPFRSFQHLITVEAQRSCLECVREHLTDDGRFVVTMFNPDIRYIVRGAENPARKFQIERVEPETSHAIRRYYEQSYNFNEQYFDCAFIYERINPDGKLLDIEYDRFQMRWTWRYEMEHLLELADFAIEALYGNYQRVPYPEASEELIFVCRSAN